MGFDARWLAKLEEAGAVSTGIRLSALKSDSPPPLATDLAILVAAVEQAGWPAPVLEHEFHPVRKWRFDLAWPDPRVALERHGGTFVTVRCTCGKPYTRFVSRHHDKNGLEMDAEKTNAAAALGWSVIVATPRMLDDGRALAAILATLERRTRRP